MNDAQKLTLEQWQNGQLSLTNCLIQLADNGSPLEWALFMQASRHEENAKLVEEILELRKGDEASKARIAYLEKIIEEARTVLSV